VEPAFRRLESAPPVHKAVQEEIRRYILAHGLRAGDPLKPEAELARLFGVSRNSVREAVKALESTGVLETRRGSGVYVRAFSFEPLLDNLLYGLMHDQDQHALAELLELRKVLETALIGDAMSALTEDSLAALREVLEEMRKRANGEDSILEQDREFHRLLFADLGNAMLLRLFELFWLAFHRAAPPARKGTRMNAYRAHAKILRAVTAGDVEQARAAIQDHYKGIRQRISGKERPRG
jgi:DNA-binding FadR family transcriptional regulator